MAQPAQGQPCSVSAPLSPQDVPWGGSQRHLGQEHPVCRHGLGNGRAQRDEWTVGTAEPGLSQHHPLPGQRGHRGCCSPEERGHGCCHSPACPSLSLALCAHPEGSEGSGSAQAGTGRGHGSWLTSDSLSRTGNSSRRWRHTGQQPAWGQRGQGLQLLAQGTGTGGTRAVTLPVLQRHKVEVCNLHGWPDLGREGEEQ